MLGQDWKIFVFCDNRFDKTCLMFFLVFATKGRNCAVCGVKDEFFVVNPIKLTICHHVIVLKHLFPAKEDSKSFKLFCLRIVQNIFDNKLLLAR